MRYCKWFSAGNRGSLLYRRNRRSAWRSDRFVDPAESNNRSANRNVDDLDQSSTDGGILDSVRTIKNSKTVKTVLICNAIIDLAVTPYLPVYTGNRFMACIKCRGAYSKKASGVTLCVVDRKQMYKAKKLIYQIDPKAFLIVSEAREVYGEGFLASDQE